MQQKWPEVGFFYRKQHRVEVTELLTGRPDGFVDEHLYVYNPLYVFSG